MRIEQLIALMVGVSLVIPLISVTGGAVINDPCEGAEVKTTVYQNSTFDINTIYSFRFSKEEGYYCVTVENKGGVNDSSNFTAFVDDKPTSPRMPTLEPGESVTVSRNVTRYLDVRRDNHTVVLGVYADENEYNFTQRSTPENSTIPSPFISNVEAIRYDSNNSTALRVETFNPSKRGYGFYIQVDTFGTDGEYTVAAPQENETSTVVIPLKESTDDVVAGKVRIFDEYGQPETKFDQKEFMAEPGNGTNYWDDEFERVPGKVDSYSYSNQTARVKYQGYDENLLTPQQKQIGAVAIVCLLVGIAFLWRRRRKYR